jgi:hypothetical protein
MDYNLNKFLIICVIIASAAHGATGGNDSLYFLYQRSTYLENLYMPGAWWANPAVTAEINTRTALTVNVMPLGNVYTIASAKYLTPIGNNIGIGVGILGFGINPNPDGSLQATNSNAQYTSHFTFSNPGLQFAAGMKIPDYGSIGLLFNIGAELLPDGNGEQSNYTVIGFGAGWLTPYFLNAMSLSISAMSTGHLWLENFWDYDGKAGMRFKTSDSLIMGSLEYTVSFVSGSIKYIGNSPAYYYQVVKGLMSFKAYTILGILLGYSQDLDIYSHNGSMLHTGLELRQSNINNFFGGYDLGISMTRRDLMVHRIWVAYCFPAHS